MADRSNKSTELFLYLKVFQNELSCPGGHASKGIELWEVKDVHTVVHSDGHLQVLAAQLHRHAHLQVGCRWQHFLNILHCQRQHARVHKVHHNLQHNQPLLFRFFLLLSCHLWPCHLFLCFVLSVLACRCTQSPLPPATPWTWKNHQLLSCQLWQHHLFLHHFPCHLQHTSVVRGGLSPLASQRPVSSGHYDHPSSMQSHGSPQSSTRSSNQTTHVVCCLCVSTAHPNVSIYQ